jgi:hypothetical protein
MSEDNLNHVLSKCNYCDETFDSSDPSEKSKHLNCALNNLKSWQEIAQALEGDVKRLRKNRKKELRDAWASAIEITGEGYNAEYGMVDNEASGEFEEWYKAYNKGKKK